MKKLLTKLCIGTVAFAVFLVVGYSGIVTGSGAQDNKNAKPSTQKKRNMIQRSNSGHYTRSGNLRKGYNSVSKSRYGVIYIGEPTEGLLD